MIEWRTHPEFVDYSISNDGKVKRITAKMGTRIGKVLKPGITAYGYHVVNVSGKMKFVHVLMLEAFVGPRPMGGEARHRNDVKSDNRILNLLWGTHADNYADRVSNGGGNHGQRHGMAKLDEDQVMAIRAMYVPGCITQSAIGHKFGVSRRCIGKIIKREAWGHV